VAEGQKIARIFKTAWFAKAARKADITDRDLCEAIQEVMTGQAEDLGGGVFKKRLNRNMHRSIILAKGGRYCLQRRTGQILKTMSLSTFVHLPRLTLL
jgi:hypothetical protein